MSIEEEDAIQKLQNLYYEFPNDPELIHFEADRILKSTLVELGYSRIVNEYNQLKEKVGFHYA